MSADQLANNASYSPFPSANPPETSYDLGFPPGSAAYFGAARAEHGSGLGHAPGSASYFGETSPASALATLPTAAGEPPGGLAYSSGVYSAPAPVPALGEPPGSNAYWGASRAAVELASHAAIGEAPGGPSYFGELVDTPVIPEPIGEAPGGPSYFGATPGASTTEKAQERETVGDPPGSAGYFDSSGGRDNVEADSGKLTEITAPVRRRAAARS